MGKVKYSFVAPENRWEYWIDEFAKETGYGTAGLFVEAENKEQAKEFLENLIKIIKENDFEDKDIEVAGDELK